MQSADAHLVPDLTVILCTRNGARFIEEQVEALLVQECDFAWEFLVIDNGSTDGTAEIVQQAWTSQVPLRIVSAAEKAGLSYARNFGVRQAFAPSVAFCDDDDVVGPNWVAAMAAALQEHALVASAMEYRRLNTDQQLVGRALFQSERIESLFGLPVCSGSCGVQKGLWEKLGGNDDSMTGIGEDFDFAMRAFTTLGVAAYFEPKAVYHYRLRAETEGVFRQSRAYGRSHVQLWIKHIDRRTTAEQFQAAAKDWWWILSRAVFAAFGRNRATWVSKFGKRLGRLEMSVRQRVFVP